jgi:cytochrome c553
MHRARPFAAVFASTFVFVGSAFAQAPAAGSEPARPDLKRGAQVVQEVCAACHAADGNSPTPANPKVAAQHADYLAKQLHDFKVKAGAEKAERASAIMAGFAAMLSDADIRSVSAYFASQTLKPAVAKNKDFVELGQKIYRGGIAAKGVPACAGCHGPAGAGIPVLYPRLQGQYAEYTELQLVAFRQGERGNSAMMSAIADRLSDREIKAVSDYIAGLR